jgi:Type VI secretion system (T6SS), amidase effector protein 4
MREAPLLDDHVYQNQCAINLSACLIRSGVDMRSFRGQWSWQKDKPKYAIRAQELADWLWMNSALIPSRLERLAGAEVFGDAEGKKGIKNRTGIVFFQNYWGPGAQGDHIDLWNGSRLTDLASLVRIYARLGSFGLGTDYRLAKSVLFFPVP